MTKKCILKILQNSVTKNPNVLAHICPQKVWLSLPLAAVGFPTKKGFAAGGFADILFGKIVAKMHKIKEIESRGGVSSATLDPPMFAISDSQSFFSIPPIGIRGESQPIDVVHLAPFHRFKAMAKDVDYCRGVEFKSSPEILGCVSHDPETWTSSQLGPVRGTVVEPRPAPAPWPCWPSRASNRSTGSSQTLLSSSSTARPGSVTTSGFPSAELEAWIMTRKKKKIEKIWSFVDITNFLTFYVPISESAGQYQALLRCTKWHCNFVSM